MKTTIFLAIVLAFAACNNPETGKTDHTDSTNTATAKKDEPWVPVDSATAMKAWMEYATPGEPHKLLAKTNGNWDGDITMWMAPGAPPVTSKGGSSGKMIMEGRYQQSAFTGNFMGQPFEGMSIMGYDNAKKVYISSWVDNMGTGIMTMEGKADAAGKSITFTGTTIDPSTGRECDMKEVYTFNDDDHHTMEMYGPDPATGKQYKTMEIKFSRKK